MDAEYLQKLLKCWDGLSVDVSWSLQWAVWITSLKTCIFDQRYILVSSRWDFAWCMSESSHMADVVTKISLWTCLGPVVMLWFHKLLHESLLLPWLGIPFRWKGFRDQARQVLQYLKHPGTRIKVKHNRFSGSKGVQVGLLYFARVDCSWTTKQHLGQINGVIEYQMKVQRDLNFEKHLFQNPLNGCVLLFYRSINPMSCKL